MSALLLLLAPSNAHAIKFANRFIEFEMPPQWTCALEQAEWVCQNTDENRKREAIIILAAKLKGDIDSLPQYLSYLKQPKSYVSISGRNMQSEPLYAKENTINGHTWIDSIHKDSEIPGFMTRYLATTKQDIAVLVTYSIIKNKYQEYLGDFENLVKTLKVFRQAGGLNSSGEGGGAAGTAGMPQGIAEGTVFPNAGGVPMPAGGGTENGGSSGQRREQLPIIPIAAGVAALLFIIWRKRQQG